MGMKGVHLSLWVWGPSLLLILQHPKKIYGLTAASGSNMDCVLGEKQRVGFLPNSPERCGFPEHSITSQTAPNEPLNEAAALE